MIKYITGNSKNLLDIFDNLELPSPDLIISSPPYYDILNYENNKNQIGFGQGTYQEYLNDVVSVFQNCYILSTPNATFWLIIDTYKRRGETITLPFDINSEFKKLFNQNTWRLKEIIIWDKEKNLPWNGIGKFKNQFEYILFYSKNEKFIFNIDNVREINDLKKWWKKYPERYNPDGKAPSNVWQFTTPLRGWGNGKQNHLCPFPFPLVEKIVSIGSNPGGIIFDPFAGSGSVLAISNLMGRDAIGIDINKKYVSLFEKEVQQGAHEYWQKRIIELKSSKLSIVDFKRTNEKLRKLKSVSNICTYLNKINNTDFVFIAIDSKDTHFLSLMIVSDQNVTITIDNKKLEDLLSQTKIKIEIEIVKEKELKGKLKNVKLFKYKFDKFFAFTSTTNISNILKKSNETYLYFYSDIAIKIN